MTVRIVEVIIDPFSLFWSYHEKVDHFGDPEALMIQCEEEDQQNDLPRGTTWSSIMTSKAL